MSVQGLSSSGSSSHSNSSQPSHQATGSLGVHGESSIFSKKETAGRLREMQSYLMTFDEVDIEEDDNANELFTRYTIDTVYASYAAAQNRVRQYTQLLHILQREADDWASKIEKAKNVMPEYRPPEVLVVAGPGEGDHEPEGMEDLKESTEWVKAESGSWLFSLSSTSLFSPISFHLALLLYFTLSLRSSLHSALPSTPLSLPVTTMTSVGSPGPDHSFESDFESGNEDSGDRTKLRVHVDPSQPIPTTTKARAKRRIAALEEELETLRHERRNKQR
ncbi:hypothetical protein P692DRAFT_20882841 [Suillus brevipes Sb2]|nr:hypothetical protein P692DRAFT_20882841 [Suillus brevipes Sb2]